MGWPRVRDGFQPPIPGFGPIASPDMTIERSTTVGAARAGLDHLMGWVGVDGLVAAMSSPGLMAVVDQHAAALREKLGDAPDVAALADYARVVHTATVRRG